MRSGRSFWFCGAWNLWTSNCHRRPFTELLHKNVSSPRVISKYSISYVSAMYQLSGSYGLEGKLKYAKRIQALECLEAVHLAPKKTSNSATGHMASLLVDRDRNSTAPGTARKKPGLTVFQLVLHLGISTLSPISPMTKMIHGADIYANIHWGYSWGDPCWHIYIYSIHGSSGLVETHHYTIYSHI